MSDDVRRSTNKVHETDGGKRKWWVYLLGGCGCLGVAAVVLPVVLLGGATALMSGVANEAGFDEEGQRQARQMAEAYLDHLENNEVDQAFELMDEPYLGSLNGNDRLMLVANAQLVAKDRQRHFSKVTVAPQRVREGKAKVWTVTAGFEYRGDGHKRYVCNVRLVNPDQLEDEANRTAGRDFAVVGLKCGEPVLPDDEARVQGT